MAYSFSQVRLRAKEDQTVTMATGTTAEVSWNAFTENLCAYPAQTGWNSTYPSWTAITPNRLNALSKMSRLKWSLIKINKEHKATIIFTQCVLPQLSQMPVVTSRSSDSISLRERERGRVGEREEEEEGQGRARERERQKKKNVFQDYRPPDDTTGN